MQKRSSFTGGEKRVIIRGVLGEIGAFESAVRLAILGILGFEREFMAYKAVVRGGIFAVLGGLQP